MFSAAWLQRITISFLHANFSFVRLFFQKKGLTIIYDKNKHTNGFEKFNACILHQITYSFINYNKPGLRQKTPLTLLFITIPSKTPMRPTHTY
ncbi:MAG: hypothetical protein ABS34_12530 [Opitutaceae bacterium BACL24 MAG-120322-bin51]|nr:MAG: hypothetical protein ABS34_12530 [Opitutaceae bacterium BACL24 MAG-120322-bin51]